LTACLLFVTGLALAGTVATIMPESDAENFENWRGSKFDRFFLDSTRDFSSYDALILFPITFDRMQINSNTQQEYSQSWYASTFEEMDQICTFFDEIAKKEINASRHFDLTNRGGDNVLAVEFRMMDFMPTSIRRGDALDTVGISSNQMGVGGLTFQAVLVESQTGNLVAVIEDGVEIRSFTNTVNDRVGRNLAWKRSFQRVVDAFHDDLRTLQKEGVD
jgi:hypothetical protein